LEVKYILPLSPKWRENNFGSSPFEEEREKDLPKIGKAVFLLSLALWEKKKPKSCM